MIDQLIQEFYSADEVPNSGWAYDSHLPLGYVKSHKEILSYVKNPQIGKFEYVQKLVDVPRTSVMWSFGFKMKRS